MGSGGLTERRGANMCYCQQCMCCIVTGGAADSNKNMLLAK
jgi:hypothetical protein